MKPLTVGDRAPDVSAVAHDGRRVALSEFFGRGAVVLFFYPKDGTSVCTKEVCAFRDAYEDFVQAGAVVLGVSSDGEESHRRFAERQNLPFTLLSDPDKALRRAFGVPKTWGFLPGRVTYILDRDGIIRHVFNAQFTADRHVVEALATVRQLATS